VELIENHWNVSLAGGEFILS